MGRLSACVDAEALRRPSPASILGAIISRPGARPPAKGLDGQEKPLTIWSNRGGLGYRPGMATSEQTIRIGVGAVVFREEEVLLIKRGKPPFEGAWSIPGGGLHYGEALSDAVIREVREETGCEIHLLGLLDVFDGLPADLGGPHVVMVDYIAEWVSGAPVAGDDAAAAEFLPFREALARLSWDTTRTALRQAADRRAVLLASTPATKGL